MLVFAKVFRSVLIVVSGLCLLQVAHSVQLMPASQPASFLHEEPQQPAENITQGHPAKRGLQVGKTHRYSIKLDTGQFLHVAITAPDIEVLITVKGPGDEPIAAVDTSDGTTGGRSVFVIATHGGDYLVELTARQPAAQPGNYNLDVVELRSATPADQPTAEAQIQGQRAAELRRKDTNESLQDAIVRYEKCVQLWQAAHRPQESIQALVSLAGVLSDLGENQKALDTLVRALTIATLADDRLAEALVLLGRGTVYNALGENEKALDDLSRALSAMAAEQDLRGQSNALQSLGTVSESQSQYVKALELFNQALMLRRRLGDQKLEAESISEIGVCLLYTSP